MRVCAMLIVLLVCTMSFAQGKIKFVQPKQKDVGVYSHETRKLNDTPVFTVGIDDRLKVLDTQRNHYKVKTSSGQVGWIEKRLVAAAAGKSFLFDDADVIGYLDNPTPVYIIDADSKDATPIKLDRSFAEALRQNVDRETIERQTK